MPARILMVDDELGMRDLVQYELSQLGYLVTVASDGLAALQLLRESEFELIISDVTMPRMNGIELLKAARALAPSTEVVIATGNADLPSAIECLRAGAFDLLEKPVDLDALVATVQRGLQRREQRELATLQTASQTIFTAKDLHALGEVIVKVTAAAMGADDALLLVPGREGQLQVAHAHGLGEKALDELRAALAVAPSAAALAEALSEPLVVDVPASHPLFPVLGSARGLGAGLTYPLRSGRRVVGVLCLHRRGDGARSFRSQDLERVGILGAQMLLALENARLSQISVDSERLAELGQLAAGVAHEINNPVAYVVASHAFLKEGADGLKDLGAAIDRGAGLAEVQQSWRALGGAGFLEDFRASLADASEGTGRIQEIASDLRTIARSDEGIANLIDLNETIRAALRIAGAEIRHRATVIPHFGPDVGIRGNAGRLSQVFVNLLVNAAQAMAGNRKAEIRVTTRREGERVIAEIADTGAGIAPEHLGRMFEAFFTTKPEGKGTGLGLSISRETVRRHGGDILVKSELGAGTTFTIILPADRAGRLAG